LTLHAVTRLKFFCGQQVDKLWSKQLKPISVACNRLKANRKENMTTGSYMHM